MTEGTPYRILYRTRDTLYGIHRGHVVALYHYQVRKLQPPLNASAAELPAAL